MKFKFIALTFLISPFIVACSSNPDAVELPACELEGNNASGCPVVIDYEGRDLHCISWEGSHREKGLTCDFVRYHKEVSDAEVQDAR